MVSREGITRMAREAGFVVDEVAQQHQPNCIFHTWHMIDEGLARFAALVAAAEREACAKTCEEEIKRVKPIYSVTAENALKAIRARGNT